MNSNFTSGCCVIIGATGGIGGALSRRLAGQGARLLVGARSEEKLRALATETGAEPFVLDATDPAQVEAAFTHAAQLFGNIYGAVNCVGSLLLKPAHLTTDADWRSTIAQSLDSAFFVLRSAARRMMSSGGSIVLISTAAARVGIANHEAIAAAKAGVAGLALSAAATYAAKGIRVNCVAPGLTETPLTARITSNEAARKASQAMHALGRLGAPDDVARAIEWFLDPEQSWVTGQVLGVDGGLGALHAR